MNLAVLVFLVPFLLFLLRYVLRYLGQGLGFFIQPSSRVYFNVGIPVCHFVWGFTDLLVDIFAWCYSSHREGVTEDYPGTLAYDVGGGVAAVSVVIYAILSVLAILSLVNTSL